ncbi:hypothetical protein DACRYDRAFT_24559 [Dacryopinax primogenitus]|uniref:Uncharacterized protein n=1 Tax=Dacryopinax primogenitus (strain DJM 731) TaxID=1858805 RepID=M5FPG8_DACPD|nr:uncharacterized protein DACRYDRAFT_24559 [Dacryopinax primogenitus]EJT98555.1 hypothetical protein DACRYDRAFT_24559 [Dacryopinax primogenitus]
MPQIGDYLAQLWSNGNVLEEHSIEWDLQRGTVTCHVLGAPASEFSLAVHFKKADKAVRIELLADGEVLDVRITDKGMKEAYITGNRLSKDEVRPFRFRSSGYDEDDPDHPPGGTITVELTFVEVIQHERIRLDEPGFQAQSDVVGSVRMGQIVRRPRLDPRQSAAFDFLPEWGDRPFATFHFKHRPRRWIEQNGMIRGRPTASRSPARAAR